MLVADINKKLNGAKIIYEISIKNMNSILVLEI